MTVLPASIYQDLQFIRRTSPVIHNITNLVVMQTCANILLAVGASPIMAHAKKELKEITSLAKSLVINIGTLDDELLDSIFQAQEVANNLKIPIILDPVGAGASCYRTEAAKKIIECGVNIVRGNSSEILALLNSENKSKGIDSMHESSQAKTAATLIADKYNCIVAVSGEHDFIVSNNHIVTGRNGHSLLSQVTGMGCGATALIAAFAAVNSDYFKAAIHAISALNIAAEIAQRTAFGPGSFYYSLIDALFNLEEKHLETLNCTISNKHDY